VPYHGLSGRENRGNFVIFCELLGVLEAAGRWMDIILRKEKKRREAR
jgi:hypothetical protein